MFPSGGIQGLSFAIGGGQLHLFPAQNLANTGDGNSGDLLRNAALGTGREEQLIFVAAMQRQRQSILATGGGQSFGVNDSASATLFADVPQVGGESVADVDHGGDQLLLAQELADGEPGLGIEVLEVRPRPQTFSVAELVESSDCCAERAGDVEEIAGPRARAQDGFAGGNAAEHHDVGEYTVRRLRRVASSEGN